MAAPPWTDVDVAAQLRQRFAECRATSKLNLGYLGLEQLPLGFVALAKAAHPRLTELDLSSNRLSTLPQELSQLSQLTVLRLKYNAFSTLPVVLTALPHLAVLEADGNQIAQLEPAVLSGLTALLHLDLSSNGLQCLPEDCSPLHALEKLALGNNSLTALPATINYSFPGLLQLDASSNALEALPPSLAGLRRLQRLDLKNNTGLERVPPLLGLLGASLKTLDLRNCRLVPRYQQAADKGLARFLAFLRDEIEVERLAEIERNRPKSIKSGPCTIYKCQTVTEDAQDSQEAGASLESFAWIRTGHALAQHANFMYMFGGTVVKDGCKSGELFWLDTDTMRWRLQPTRGDKPCPRDGHAMALETANNRLWVFGGKKQNGRRLSDLYCLDLYTWTWWAPRTDGEPPCPRDQCSAIICGTKLVVFGGRTYGSRLCDLWTLDLESFSWELCAPAGTVPPPRQGAALAVDAADQLWLHGGAGHFVLDDLYTYDFEAEEWSTVAVEGRCRPARVGHILTFHEGELRLFGGLDQLAAHNWIMYHLVRQGANMYEWVETIFSMQQNRSRCCLFSNGQLNIMQVGHPLHDLPAPKDEIVRGRVIYDVFQSVPLLEVPDKQLGPEDRLPSNPKQARIALTLEERGVKLPAAFKTHTRQEARALQHALAFAERWAAEHPWRPTPWLAAGNECGVEKLVCTTLQRAVLPHTELHDLEGVCRLLGEFFTYEPLEEAGKPPAQLASPAAVLKWQAGDSFDLATLACSLLLGAGYRAYVALGYTGRAVALGEHGRQECPRLQQLGIASPAYSKLPEELPEMEEDPEAAAAQAAAEAAAAEAAAAAKAAAEAAAAAAAVGQPLEPIKEEEQAAEAGQGAETKPGKASRPVTGRSTRTAGSSRPSTRGRSASPSKAPASKAAGKAEAKNSAATATPKPGSGGSKVKAAGRSPAKGKAATSRPATAAGKASRPGTGKASKPAEVASRPATASFEAGEPAAEDVRDSKPAENSPQEAVLAEVVELGLTLASTAEADAVGAPGPPPMRPKRYVHAFVVVRPGRRQVSDVLLIDPATGTCWPTAEAPCSGIEFIWDDGNYYCNVQQQQQQQQPETGTAGGDNSGSSNGSSSAPSGSALLTGTSSSRLPALGSMDWNLRNPNAWCALLPATQAETADTRTTATEHSSGTSLTRPSQSRVAVLASELHGSISSLAGGSTASRQCTPRDALLPAGAQPFDRHKSVALHVLTARGSPPVLAHTGGPEPGMSSLSYLAPDESAALASSPTMAVAAGHAAAAMALAAAQLPAGPEMPPSWVPKLQLSREALDVRCPRGAKTIAYRQCKRELAAAFGECARWDGLVERISTYLDSECTMPDCVVELFARRRDCLERRDAWPGLRVVRESFARGAVACLARSEVSKSGRRELAFYHESRADALMRRVEVPGVSMEEYFGRRADHLASRIVQYAMPNLAAAQLNSMLRRGSTMRRGSAAVLAAAANVGAAGGSCSHRRSSVMNASALPEFPVCKVTQTYRWEGDAEGQQGALPAVAAAQAAAPASARVVKRTFWLNRGQLKVVVRQADGQLTTRKYDMDGPVLRAETGADGTLSPEQQHQEWQALREAARAAEAAVRLAAEESDGVLAARRLQEQDVQLVTAHCDAARVKVEDSDDELAGADDEEWDILAPFLPNTGARDMTEAEAEGARAACLAALAERLAERERLIRGRVEAETAEAARLEGTLVEDRHRMGPAEVLKLEEQAAQARFRLRVASRRLEGHPAQAAVRRQELEQRLAADKRLTAARQGRPLRGRVQLIVDE